MLERPGRWATGKDHRPLPQELPLPELYGMDPVGAQRDAVGVGSFAETAVERTAA